MPIGQPPTDPSVAAAPPAPVTGEEPAEADLLVEDVSIDGMCGVY